MWKSKKKSSEEFYGDFVVVDKDKKAARKPSENNLARRFRDIRSHSFNQILQEDEGDYAIEVFNSIDSLQSPSRSPKGKSNVPKSVMKECGETYHMDVWFLLSTYIRPEDIKTFALLCKSSYFVTQTYSFWMGIYKRYYKSGIELPLRLQPHCIKRPNCFKASVIRSLYYIYPPLSTSIPSNRSTPNFLKINKFICVSMWHTKVNKQWSFFFKFQSPKFSSSPCLINDKRKRESSHWDTYEYSSPETVFTDVNRNPDEGCKILSVLTSEFVAVPIVMGGHLIDIKCSLSRDMRKHELVLTFTFTNYVKASMKNQPIVPRSCGGTGEIVIFHTVDSITLQDWWHPQYPIGNTFE